jgi:hypothetical protein
MFKTRLFLCSYSNNSYTSRFICFWAIFKHLFLSSTHTQRQCISSYHNSTAMYKFLKTLHSGGIRSRDLFFFRRTRWPLCNAAAPGHLHMYIHTEVCVLDQLLLGQKSFDLTRRFISSFRCNRFSRSENVTDFGRKSADSTHGINLAVKQSIVCTTLMECGLAGLYRTNVLSSLNWRWLLTPPPQTKINFW